MSSFINCRVAAAVASALILTAFGPFGRGGNGSFPVNPVQLVETFTVESATGGTVPFDRLVALPDEVGNGVTVDTANSQSECVSVYPSGSCRLSHIAGSVTLSAGVPLAIDVYSGQQAQGAALTAADIDAAAPTSVVGLGVYGSASLAAQDLTAPKKVWYSGPHMILAEYQAVVATDFRVTWFVSLFSDDRVRVWGTVSNVHFGAITKATVSASPTTYEKTFTPSVSVGGVTVWDNAGAPFHMYEFTQIAFNGWIGGDPDLEIIHDHDALIASGAVTNYWRGPTEAQIAAKTGTYSPGDNGDWDESMASSGSGDHIGILPEWDSRCVASADPRACDYALVQALAYGEVPTFFVDENTGEPVKPSDRPNWTINGFQVGNSSSIDVGAPNDWEIAHHPAAGYLAFLLTGNPIHYKTLQHTAAVNFLTVNWTFGSGTNRLQRGQVRSRAWGLRTNGYMAAAARPDDAIAADYKALLETNVAAMHTESQAQPQNWDTGFFYHWANSSTECLSYDQFGNCAYQMFMQDFLVAATGLVDRLNVLTDETDLHEHMDTAMNVVLFRGGAGGVDEFCYNVATKYQLIISTVSTTDTSQWDLSPKEIYDYTCADTVTPIECDTPATACTNVYKPELNDDGNFGNWLTGLAAALEYSGTRTEALAVLARIKGVTGWPAFIADTNYTTGWAVGDPADFN